MVIAKLKLLGIVLPHVPLVARTALMHLFCISEAAKYLDLRTEVMVAFLRAFLLSGPPRSITQVQRLSMGSRKVTGPMWVSTYGAPAPPEPDIRDALLAAMDRLEPGSSAIRVPDLVDVEAEWTGYRANATPGQQQQRQPSAHVSERELYHEMMRECKKPTTILYLHGGAYYLCDPATHRPTAVKLAKLTGGRSYSVRYRLAPKHPFPSQLLDALVSYFTLLYPSSEAFHQPVKPEHIVFAGDSAGGNLALALVQLILEIHRQPDPRIMWNGELRKVPLPAAVACNSPWVDTTQCSPAWEESTPTPYDFIPKPDQLARMKTPDCAIWPASPPRRHMFIDDHLMAHPLATLVMARDWTGAPPMYICTGWEVLASEDKYFVQRMEASGVTVVFEEYEAMPHCFAIVMGKACNARRCMEGWSNFIRDAVENPEKLRSTAVTIKAKTGEEVPLKFESLCDVTQGEIQQRVMAKSSMSDLERWQSKL